MRNWLLIVIGLGVLASGGIIQPAHAQITVNSTTPCFMNYSAGADMWENCGIRQDYLKTMLLPWEWITGGYFSMIIVGIFILFSYIKYQKIIYPMIAAVFFLPVAYFLFPTVFLMWGMIMAAVGVAALIYYVFVRQTKEYNG